MNDFGMNQAPDDGLRQLSRAAVLLGAIAAATICGSIILDPRWLHALTGSLHPFWFILATGTAVAALAAATGTQARYAAQKNRVRRSHRRLDLLAKGWYCAAGISMAVPAIFAAAPPAQGWLHTLWLTGLPYTADMHEHTRYGILLASALSKLSAATILATLTVAASAWKCEREREEEPQ